MQPSPQRNNKSKAAGMINRYSPTKQTKGLKDRYIKQGSPTRTSQEQMFSEAKRILDMHINYLSRGCYYYFRDAIARFDDDCMALLRSYRHHEDSDQLVSALTLFFNDREADVRSLRQANSRSPVRTTSASVASQDRLRGSMQRERGGETIQTDFAPIRTTGAGGQRRSYSDLKEILGFSNRYTFDDVSSLLVKHIQLHGDLNAA